MKIRKFSTFITEELLTLLYSGSESERDAVRILKVLISRKAPISYMYVSRNYPGINSSTLQIELSPEP